MQIIIHSRKQSLAAFDAAAERIELQLRKLHEKSKSINHDSLRYRAD